MPLLNKEKMMDGFGKAVDAVNNAADKAGRYAKEKELALRNIDGYRIEPATNALWFKNPGTNVDCPETFYGRLSGKYKKHCFYNPGLKDNCDL